MDRRAFNSLALFWAQAKPKPRRRARDLFLESVGGGEALGLRYTVFRNNEGTWVEAPLDALRTGDRIRLLVESSGSGQLHVLTRNAAGEWEPAAPDLPVEIDPERAFTLPPTGQWVLDPPAGVETLCLVLWREGDGSLDEVRAEPAKLIAAAETKSRDLVQETVSGPHKEAHYVVNPDTDKAAKVVVELRIRHR